LGSEDTDTGIFKENVPMKTLRRRRRRKKKAAQWRVLWVAVLTAKY